MKDTEEGMLVANTEEYIGPKREKQWWEYYPLHKVWCNDYCPLVPRYFHREADEWNTDSYSVHWLIFHVWTMDHLSFGVDAGISFDEIYVGAILPYLRITVGFRHIHTNLTMKLNRFFRRKSENDKKSVY